MAIVSPQQQPQIHRFPQFKYVDGVRWLSSLSTFSRLAVIALFDSDSDSSSIEIHSLTQKPLDIAPHSTWTSPSRVSSLKTSQLYQNPLVFASTYTGSLHVLSVEPMEATLDSELSVPEKMLHDRPISCVDVMDGGGECLTVSEDGRVNLVSIGESGLNYSRIFDSNGLVSYTAVKWASPTEFATGGCGFSLQWWDQRKPGGAVSQFKADWASGIVHGIDIHPSRKHTCLAGGSFGTVFAWDLRSQQQPIILSGLEGSKTSNPSPCESEVWEVHYDPYIKSGNLGGMSSSQILPAMICSEDGILTSIEQGKQPVDLLAEPCAINGFDIDRHHPSEVICNLEWESIAILSRS
ncbi:nuclear pore complex protein NUP43 [Benincasa hispida]|uniref:nuclear pore complex protein NUP43 n=1 Tax=Benincasa hispida TaxID=102211 RepID=UPI0018FFB65E|nr:nuclear pore complex protein NUP43 [Benincasa hispida]